jgi:hypothetical protein
LWTFIKMFISDLIACLDHLLLLSMA